MPARLPAACAARMQGRSLAAAFDAVAALALLYRLNNDHRRTNSNELRRSRAGRVVAALKRPRGIAGRLWS